MTAVLETDNKAKQDDVEDKSRPKATKIKETHAPKRPEKLSCDVYHMQVRGEKWSFFVGMMEDKPYEIFAGRAKHIQLPKNKKDGYIKKNGTYNFYSGEGESQLVIQDLAGVFENTTESAFTRTVSLALRHGVPIQYLVEQLEKGADKENEMFSLSKGLVRVLKNYIKDGTKPAVKKCAQCDSSELVYQEGCILCHSCGYSRCG
jgi:ribonucleoside-diphosphate reductase alpha chain